MKMTIENLPTPIETIMDPISLSVIGIYLALIIWEKLTPARPLPKIKYWKIKGFVTFIIFFYLSTYLPLIWDGYLSNFQLFDLTDLGTYFGAAVGIFIYEIGVYIWHRSIHSNSFLWRVFHQMHHSSERIDSYGAFYFSPLDMIGFTFLGSLCLVVIAGFTAEASTLIIVGTTFLSIFQHSNIKTPRWLGYFIQRPESHSYHHARGNMPLIILISQLLIYSSEHLEILKPLNMKQDFIWEDHQK